MVTTFVLYMSTHSHMFLSISIIFYIIHNIYIYIHVLCVCIVYDIISVYIHIQILIVCGLFLIDLNWFKIFSYLHLLLIIGQSDQHLSPKHLESTRARPTVKSLSIPQRISESYKIFKGIQRQSLHLSRLVRQLVPPPTKK